MNNIDWSSLPFGYFKTDYNVRCYFRDGKWGEIETSSSEEIVMHMAATCLHYGQAAFEGMKAFRGVDGKIRLFRPNENAKRMISSANGILMAPVPEDLFVEACKKVVKLNERFVPPAGSGASLYLRPILIGTGAQVGVHPADEYLFMIFTCPVGPYFKEGFKPVKFQIAEDFDRAAPLGTGRYKVGGNYAASLYSGQRAHDEGYSNCIYLDAKEKKYIDEAGAANFFGIKNNTYCTPKSTSILPSITNMSLRQLALDMGMKVEERQIPVEELSTFEEVAACGTAAVVSPINQIEDRGTGKVYKYAENPGPVCTKLYHTLKGIQDGSVKDTHNWNLVIE
ncbi:MAG: branched-chain amino acid aminotransferase [Bacteroidales bacterium]|jgi:branched-chain amino acid aminotransferase|nr:branched-chain amino acid aminotransferase [Bacteroidales bacterium]